MEQNISLLRFEQVQDPFDAPGVNVGFLLNIDPTHGVHGFVFGIV